MGTEKTASGFEAMDVIFWKQLTDDQKLKWRNRAKELKRTELGLRHKTLEKKLKTYTTGVTTEQAQALWDETITLRQELANICTDLWLEMFY